MSLPPFGDVYEVCRPNNLRSKLELIFSSLRTNRVRLHSYIVATKMGIFGAQSRSNCVKIIGFGIAIVFGAVAGTAVADQWQVVTVNKVTLEGTLRGDSPFEVRIESDTPKETSGDYFGATDAPRSVVAGI